MCAYVTGEAFILFHETFVLLVDFEDFADSVGGSFRLKRHTQFIKTPVMICCECDG